MVRKFILLFFLFLLAAPTTQRVLQDVVAESDGEQLSPSEIDPLAEENDDRELIVRPQNINVSLLQKSFNDTLLHLKAEDNIRIRIKVHNQKFLPFFN